MRLFIASPVTLDDYAQIQKDLGPFIEGRWTAEENLHLTWLFLGEQKDPAPVIERLQTIHPLERSVDIADLGYFGKPPRILYGRADSTQLYDKANELRKAGFDLYRFKPHITLCRIKKIRDYRAYKEFIRYYRGITLGTVLPQIALYQSTLSPEGASYTQLYDTAITAGD